MGTMPCLTPESAPISIGGQDWNPRYVRYCYAHGFRDPVLMLDHDCVRWPGGQMAGFLLWMMDRWAEWHQRTGWPRSGPPPGPEEHADFDRGLAAQFPEPAATVPA